MHIRVQRFIRRLGIVPWLAAVSFLHPALAAPEALRSAAQTRYQLDRAACLRGESNQGVQTCLKEAAAVRGEAGLAKPADDAELLLRNRLRRCDPLPQPDRDACVARMSGAGTATGSAAGGGIYRELVTTEPAASEPAR